MIELINNFVYYHPYTITGLYGFSGIIIGFTLNAILTYLMNGLSKLTNFPFNKILKRVFGKYIILFFTIWGIYNVLERSISDIKWSGMINTAYELFVTFVACMILLRTIIAIIRRRSKKDIESLTSTSIVENVTKITGYIIILFIILTKLGIPVAPILTALGVGGIAIALAFQDILSNLFSGIFVIASSQIKPGDFVKLENGIEGFIADVSWRNTTIRELAGNYVYVPNSKIATSTITNYRHPNYELNVIIDFSVSYDADLNYVENIAYEVAREIQMLSPGTAKDFDPIVRVKKFNEYSIDCIIVMRVLTFLDQYAVKSDVIKALHVKFKECGVEIPFPITTLKLYHDHFKVLDVTNRKQ